MITKICAYEPCSIEFTTKRHNQIYCCDEHCKLATNARIMAKYYATKARKKGAVRVCRTPGCSTRLSRYNPDDICGKCEAEIKAAKKDEMKEFFKELGL